MRTATGSGPETSTEETTMRWNKPTVVEMCVGLEINGYFPPEY